MTNLTPEQRITLSAIDAAGNIAEAAQAIAHALTEAASVLRQITSPYGSEPCHGDCGWPPEEDLVDDEAPEEPAEDQPQNTEERFRAFVARQTAAKNELPIERPLDVERSDAGFTSGPIWVGGPGWSSPGEYAYWSADDRGITHAMLMDACEGLSNAERRAAHIRAGKAAAIAGKTPTVRDLIDGLAVIRGRRVDMGPIPHEDELVEQINARFGPTAAADGRPDCKASMLAVGGECPICQTALTSCPFDAECAPPLGAGHLTLELWAKKLTTRHMAYLDSHPMFRDELEDLRTQAGRLQQAALDGVRLMKAAEPSVVLESAYDAARPVADVVEALEGTPPTTGDDPDWVAPAREPSSCGRSWDEAGSPVTRDAALAELQRLGQEFDAAAREFGDLGWMSPIIDAAKDLSLGELEHLVETLENPQEPKDAPNSAEPHPSADACETGSSASPAASELTPDGIEIHHPVKCSGPMRIQADLSRDVWDMSASPSAPVAPSLDLETAYGADLDVIAAEQFDVRRTPGETDSSLRAFLRAKQRADDDLSGCRWVNPVATATDPAADRADLARVTPAALRSADLSGAWRGIAGSQAVEAGGRLPAVAIDKPIQD